MKKTFFYLFTLWMLLWGQIMANHFLGGTVFATDLILIGALYFGLTRGPLAGVLIGLILGLLVDASSLGLMGLHTLLYASAGYLAGILRRQLDEEKPWTQGIFTFAISLLYVVLYLMLEHLFLAEARPFSLRVLAKPMANALIAPIVFSLLHSWSLLWDYRPEES